MQLFSCLNIMRWYQLRGGWGRGTFRIDKCPQGCPSSLFQIPPKVLYSDRSNGDTKLLLCYVLKLFKVAKEKK